jgi:hypothetical protein
MSAMGVCAVSFALGLNQAWRGARILEDRLSEELAMI